MATIIKIHNIILQRKTYPFSQFFFYLIETEKFQSVTSLFAYKSHDCKNTRVKITFIFSSFLIKCSST